LEALAAAATEDGDARRAARFFGAAAALRVILGPLLPLAAPSDRDACLDSLRRVLGEEQFRAAWNAGRALTVDGALADAPEQLDVRAGGAPRRRGRRADYDRPRRP